MTSKQVVKALKISGININDINISNQKNNRTVAVKLKDELLIFQTPYLEITDKLRKTPYQDIYQLDTLFKGDSKHRIHRLYQFIENLETYISGLVEKNGTKWFSQKNVILKSLIREVESKKGLFYIKWPLNLKNNIFIDENKKIFDPLQLKSGDLIKLIVEISNLWIDNNQFGLAVIVQKIMVKPYQEKQQSEYIFDTESEHESESKTNEIISLLATEQKTRKPCSDKNENPLNDIKLDKNTKDNEDKSVKKKFEEYKSKYLRQSPNKENKISPKIISKIKNESLHQKQKSHATPIVRFKQDQHNNIEPDPLNTKLNQYHEKKYNYFKTNDDFMEKLMDNYSQSDEIADEINEEDLEFDNN